MFTRSTESLRKHTSPPSTAQEYRPHISSWIWELLSFIVSFVCIGGILVILAKYDQKPLPNLGWLTINGIIGTLAGVAKAALILPISESISQLKWLRFWDHEHPKPVSDFQLYDSASRGPWGSLCLLVCKRPRMMQLASLGAVLTVLALAMETFLQLIPIYPTRMVPLAGHPTSIGIMKDYNDIVYNSLASTARTAPSGAKGAFYSALFGTSNDAWNMQPVCPTGNCTWAPYSSLAVCSSCTNLTSLINKKVIITNQYNSTELNQYGSKGNFKMRPMATYSLVGAPFTSVSTLENGLDLRQFTGSSIVTYNISAGETELTDWSLAYKAYQNMSIVQATPMFWAPGKFDRVEVTPQAFECLLYFCVNTYSASVKSGKLTETIVNSWPDPRAPMPDSLSQQHSVQELYDIQRDVMGVDVPNKHMDNSSIVFKSPAANGTEHALDWLTLNSLRQWLSNAWDSVSTSSASDIASITYNSYATGSRESLNTTTLPQMTVAQAQQATVAMPGPEQLWSDVARSMTLYLRSSGSESAPGVAMSAQTFVSARWAWAILPLSLLGLALFFVSITVVISSRRGAPLWKSNSLPSLLLGLNAETSQAMIGFSRSAQNMEKQGRLYDMAMSHDRDFARMEAKARSTLCT